MENKKNNVLLYLALSIAGAFLLHKLYMSRALKKSSPVMPGPPPNIVPGNELTQTTIKTLTNTLVQNSLNPDTITQGLDEYNFAKTYQTLYGKTLSGVYNSCPTII